MDTPIERNMLIPAVLQQYPACRAVLDRYGLHGCGGALGPPESLAYFARAHQVDEARLLQELNQAAPQSPEEPLAYEETLGDTLYRRFFKAGIVTILTVGCLWGAINLALIGLHRSFFAPPYNWTLAHGHAQIFGWIGFFVMGFAYQAFPRFRHTTLWRPDLARASLWLMGSGILLRVIAQVGAPRSGFLALGAFSGLLEFAAIAIFLAVLVRTFRASDQPLEFNARFIFAAFLWFAVQGLLNPLIFWLFAAAPDQETLIERVATYNIPFRDIQFLGFAMMLIFGVSLRFLPTIYGLRKPSTRVAQGLFVAFNLLILADLGSYLAWRGTGVLTWAMGLQFVYLGLLGVAVGMVTQLGVFGPATDPDRSLKFIRAAYAWLLIAMAMLAMLPLYNHLTRQGFSHAFFGAYRHALTVGFISLMIMGVSSKVSPLLAGLDPHRMNPLTLAFVLINLGNALRVVTQILTDFTPWAFSVVGISGFIEVIALALYGMDLWRTLNAGAHRYAGETLSQAA